MKILVLGAKGMLGRDLTPLLGAKYRVFAMDLEELDICRPAPVAEEINRLEADVVINAAAYTDVDGSETHREKAFSVNAEGARNIAMGCAGAGARMIHLSTDYIFDGLSPRPYREDDLPNPLNAYGASKREGEEQIRRTLENHLIIRTAWLYGHHGKNFVKAILRQASEKKELRVVSDQRGSPTFTKDLSLAILHLVETGARGAVHVTNSQSCTWLDFASQILKEKGLNEVSVIPITTAELNRPARRPANSVLDCSHYESLTGKKMRPWWEGLRDYLFQEPSPPEG